MDRFRYLFVASCVVVFVSISLHSCTTGNGKSPGEDAAGSWSSAGYPGSIVSGGSGVSGGTVPAPVTLCGNGIIDEGEQCDGSNLGSETCTNLGEGDGVLMCSASCAYDTSMCTQTQPAPGGYGG